jgi:hypothetical protein
LYKIEIVTASNTRIVTTQAINAGDVIGTWVANYPTGGRYLFNEPMTMNWYETTDLGRYCNHSDTPNTTVEIVNLENGQTELILISNGIALGEEILVDYKIVERETGYIVNTNF